MSGPTSMGLNFGDFDAVKLKYGDKFDCTRENHQKLINKLKKPDGPLARRAASGELKVIYALLEDDKVVKVTLIPERSNRTPDLKLIYKNGIEEIVEITTITSAPVTRVSNPKTGKPWKTLREITLDRIPTKDTLKEAIKRKGISKKKGVEFVKTQIRVYNEKIRKLPGRIVVIVPRGNKIYRSDVIEVMKEVQSLLDEEVTKVEVRLSGKRKSRIFSFVRKKDTFEFIAEKILPTLDVDELVPVSPKPKQPTPNSAENSKGNPKSKKDPKKTGRKGMEPDDNNKPRKVPLEKNNPRSTDEKPFTAEERAVSNKGKRVKGVKVGDSLPFERKKGGFRKGAGGVGRVGRYLRGVRSMGVDIAIEHILSKILPDSWMQTQEEKNEINLRKKLKIYIETLMKKGWVLKEIENQSDYIEKVIRENPGSLIYVNLEFQFWVTYDYMYMPGQQKNHLLGGLQLNRLEPSTVPYETTLDKEVTQKRISGMGWSDPPDFKLKITNETYTPFPGSQSWKGRGGENYKFFTSLPLDLETDLTGVWILAKSVQGSRTNFNPFGILNITITDQDTYEMSGFGFGFHNNVIAINKFSIASKIAGSFMDIFISTGKSGENLKLLNLNVNDKNKYVRFADALIKNQPDVRVLLLRPKLFDQNLLKEVEKYAHGSKDQELTPAIINTILIPVVDIFYNGLNKYFLTKYAQKPNDKYFDAWNINNNKLVRNWSYLQYGSTQIYHNSLGFGHQLSHSGKVKTFDGISQHGLIEIKEPRFDRATSYKALRGGSKGYKLPLERLDLEMFWEHDKTKITINSLFVWSQEKQSETHNLNVVSKIILNGREVSGSPRAREHWLNLLKLEYARRGLESNGL